MSDCMPAKMTIGGEMTAAVKAELIDLIRNESPDEYAPGDESQPLSFEVYEQPWGAFDEIEAFCRAHGLTYVRHADSKYEFDAVNVWWSPQIQERYGEPLQGYATQNGQPLIEVESVKDLLEDSGQPVRDTLRMLEDATPVTVPPLTVRVENPQGR